MFAAVLYILSLSVGLILSKQLIKNPIVRLCVSLVIGIVISSWILFFTAVFSTMQISLYFSSLLIIIFIIWRSKNVKITRWNRQIISSNWNLILFILFWTALLLPLFDSHMIKLTPAGDWQTGGNTYGDLALHISFISKFSEQNELSLQSPIFSAQQTTYPFMINFFAAMLVRAGASTRTALIATSFPFVIVFLVTTYAFLQSVTKSTRTGWIFSFLFLFNGGAGIYYLFSDWTKSQDSNFFVFLTNLKYNYSHLADYNIRWTNIIADYLLPQRTMVVGMSIFSVIVFLYNQIHNKYSIQARYLIAVIIGLTPFFHIHTFLVLFLLSVWIDLWHIYFKKANWLDCAKAILITILLALPQLYWQFAHTFNTSFSRFYIGWMRAENESLLTFWFKNLGLSSILWIIAPITLWRLKKTSFLKIISFPLLLIFIITNLFIFQPHNFDNMKFMILSYFSICLLGSVTFFHISKKSIAYNILTVLTIFLISTTGIISYYRETYTLYNISTASDIAIAEKIKESTDPHSILLTADNHNHLIMIAGRSSVLIHPGWLWTHGIDYLETQKDVQSIFSEDFNAKELIKKHNIDYVLIGNNEKLKFRPNISYFDANFEKIYLADNSFLYKVK